MLVIADSHISRRRSNQDPDEVLIVYTPIEHTHLSFRVSALSMSLPTVSTISAQAADSVTRCPLSVNSPSRLRPGQMASASIIIVLELGFARRVSTGTRTVLVSPQNLVMAGTMIGNPCLSICPHPIKPYRFHIERDLRFLERLVLHIREILSFRDSPAQTLLSGPTQALPLGSCRYSTRQRTK